MAERFVIGIDEAGRGPIAGPVAVAACLMSHSFLRRAKMFFPKGVVRDSKKLAPRAREKIFETLKAEKEKGTLSYAVFFGSATLIDRRGIVFAITEALGKCLESFLVSPESCRVLLDGSLHAPEKFKNQKTIIKGDESQAIIALASIVAKVSRDKKMREAGLKDSRYGFEIHKGYGTKAHYVALERHGLSPIHRRSFLKNFSPIKSK